MSIYPFSSPNVIEPTLPITCLELKSTQLQTVDYLGNVLYSFPASTVPDPQDLMVFNQDGTSSFVSTSSLLPANPNALINDSGLVQLEGAVWVADSLGVGGSVASASLSAPSGSVNVLSNAPLEFVNNTSSLSASIQVNTTDDLIIQTSTGNPGAYVVINPAPAVPAAPSVLAIPSLGNPLYIGGTTESYGQIYADVGLTTYGNIIYNNTIRDVQTFLDTDNVLNFKSAESYNFDANINCPNLLSNPLTSDLNCAARGVNNAYNITLHGNFGSIDNQFNILENPQNVLSFNGATAGYTFDNSITTTSLDGKVTTTFVRFYDLLLGQSVIYTIVGNNGVLGFSSASIYQFDNKIQTTNSVSADQGITSGSSVNINNNSGLYFNNVLTSNYSVINSDGMVSDNLLINTQGTGQVLINNNQIQTCVNGDSASRPLSPPAGFQYFDTTLGYPVWYNGSVYVNALGGPV